MILLALLVGLCAGVPVPAPSSASNNRHGQHDSKPSGAHDDISMGHRGEPVLHSGKTHLLLIHHKSEGAHAHADALDNLPCVNFLRNELLQPDVDQLSELFDTPSEKLSSVMVARNKNYMRYVNGFAKQNIINKCSCTSRGSLVRLDAENMRDLCDQRVFMKLNIQPVVLVRTDLMRWSLSVMGRDLSALHQNEQFCGTGLYKDRPCVVTKVHYNISLLHRRARLNVQTWRAVVSLLKAAHEGGLKPMMSVYEDFDDNGLNTKVMLDQLIPCEPRRHQLPTTTHSSISHVHSHKISEFVLNSREVHSYFARVAHPTFSDILDAGGMGSLVHLFGHDRNFNVSSLTESDKHKAERAALRASRTGAPVG